MRKIICTGILALLMSVTSVASASAVKDDNTFLPLTVDFGSEIKLKDYSLKIKLNKEKENKEAGEKFSIKAKTNYDGYEPTFYSTDNKVATVTKEGKVTCKSAGKAKIVAECNGIESVCKVNVEPKFAGNTIADSKMSSVAGTIGWQTQHAYPQSSVMCSAYSFAYAYYQVTGKVRTPGSFWYGGGCTWDGGTYHRLGSSSAMLAKIKSELDQNRACVGLLSMRSSSTHYVTFYGYTGDGTSLSDFKILDPWDGTLRSGSEYGYCYSGYHVATVNV